MSKAKEKEGVGPIYINLLTPLTADFYCYDYPEDQDEGYDPTEPEELDGRELAQFEGEISRMVERENRDGVPLMSENQEVCNLMDYFDGRESIAAKVDRAVVSVKCAEGELYGCTMLELNEFLDTDELHELCEYITGQYADGWGEGAEQRDIPVEGGYLNVHFWQGEGFRFRSERVQASTEQAQGKPAPENGKSGKAEPERPKLKLSGHDGNVFAVMAHAARLLKENGQLKEAAEMQDRVWGSHNYYTALGIISEYVETELSSPISREQKDRKSQNSQVHGQKDKGRKKGENCR